MLLDSFSLTLSLIIEGSGYRRVCSFCIGKKEPKTLGEKNALHKAGTRTLIFRRPQPAPFLTDHFSLTETY